MTNSDPGQASPSISRANRPSCRAGPVWLTTVAGSGDGRGGFLPLASEASFGESGLAGRRERWGIAIVPIFVLILTACSSAAPIPSTSAAQLATKPSRAHTIFTHCGFYETDFDGVRWTPDSIGRGTSPEGTGFNATVGTMTRIGDRALFESDAGFEIWFKPAPDDLPPPPPCD